MDAFHSQWLFALAPFGCRSCGIPRAEHGRQYTERVGVHSWSRPTERQIKNRMLIRRRHMGAYRWR
jgi:hypothetical protein